MNYVPNVNGIVEISPGVAALIPYIDWTAFLQCWGFRGTMTKICAEPERRIEVEKLLADAHALLARIAAEQLLTPLGVCAIFPCEKSGDDLIVDHGRETLYTLRQQQRKSDGMPYYALADFVKPEDYIGMFAVTCGDGLTDFKHSSRNAGDDYSAILAQMLSDRLAEAFSEYIHEKMRREIWGYVPDESLTPQQLLTEKVQGIRPAPGYPCQPDHSEKFTLFRLLDAEKRLNVTLTESALMVPESSVCAICFARPQAVYFSLGRIAQDQFADYAERKGWDEPTARKWLAPVIAF